MEIVEGLSVLWSVACIAATLYAIWWLWQDDEVFMSLLCLGLGLPIMAFMAAVPWLFIADQKSPDLVTLKKGQWACSASRLETTLMPISTGKTTMLVPTTHSVCITYSKTS